MGQNTSCGVRYPRHFRGRLFSLSIINRVSSSVIPEGISPFGKYENTQGLTGHLGVMLGIGISAKTEKL